MRIALHFKAEHPESGGEESVGVYRLGRIEEGVHNAPVGHDPVPIDEYVGRLLAQARREYPGPHVEVVLERMIDNGDGTSSWIPADQFDPESHSPTVAGRRVERTLEAQAVPSPSAGTEV